MALVFQFAAQIDNAWAAALAKEREEDFRKDDPYSHCLPLGVPRINTANRPFKIYQLPNAVVILYEATYMFREIFMDGRPLPKDPQPTWMGYSVGRWQGDTLVVETSGFNDKAWLDGDKGHPHTDALRVTERFRRVNFGTLEIEATIDDPKAYTKPFTVKQGLHLIPDSELLENICDENEERGALSGQIAAHRLDRHSSDNTWRPCTPADPQVYCSCQKEGFGPMKIFAIAIILTAVTIPLAAQWVHYPTLGIPRTADGKPNLAAPAPRTADGKPDLTGLWSVLSPDTAIGNIALRKPGDLKPADIQPWAQALVQQRAENFGIDNPHYKCLPDGPNYITAGGIKRLIQTPAMIAMLNDDLTYRVIHTDGRALEADPNPSWMGYSVGSWDGDTLVVESNGYNDRTWLLSGYPHTEALHMTERFRRTDFGHMEITVSFQDSGAYNKAWTLSLRAQLAADTELMEDVCGEFPDNGQQHWIGKASDDEKTAVEVAPEVLAKYVGVYKGIYLRNPRTVDVTSSGGALMISVNGGPKQPVYPQSETNFSGTGLAYQFIRDSNGIATHVVETHVSGDYKFERQK